MKFYLNTKQKSENHKEKEQCPEKWSGRWDLNPRHQPWQGCTLPLSYTRMTGAIITSFLNKTIEILKNFYNTYKWRNYL